MKLNKKALPFRYGQEKNTKVRNLHEKPQY